MLGTHQQLHIPGTVSTPAHPIKSVFPSTVNHPDSRNERDSGLFSLWSAHPPRTGPERNHQ